MMNRLEQAWKAYDGYMFSSSVRLSWADGRDERRKAVESAARAQMDEDITRLVAAGQRLLAEHEDFLMNAHGYDRETVANVIDLPGSTAAVLRAALEPFKAVPTAVSTEVEG